MRAPATTDVDKSNQVGRAGESSRDGERTMPEWPHSERRGWAGEEEPSDVSERNDEEHGEGEVQHDSRVRRGEPEENRGHIAGEDWPGFPAFGLELLISFAVRVEVLAPG